MGNDIAVVIEHLEGKVADISFEMLGKGRELAKASGGRLVALLLGHGVKGLSSELGCADTVIVVEHEALRPYCRDARLAGGRLTAVSQIYGGKLLAHADMEGPSAILSILAGSFPAEAGKAAGNPRVEEVPPPPLDKPRIRFKRLIQPEAGDVDITRQAVLVSVGRGIQSKDNIPVVEELAQALGGALSASRPIVDQGWLPKTRQVGKSGMTVKPKLYVAVGISGAPEHIEGMRGAELIVAINTD